MPERYLTLDAIRGTAAIAVLMLHGADWFGVLRPQAGYLAVDLFFALSGFIIARIYVPRFRGGLGVGAFTAERLIRFWPLYMAGTLLGLILYTIATPSLALIPQFLGAAVFLPTGTNYLYPLNRVAWSLGLELAINIIFAATWHLATVRRLIALLVISGVALIYVAARDGHLQGGFALATIDTGAVRCVFSFTLGVLLERIEPRLRLPHLPAWVLTVAPLALVWRSWGAVFELVVVMVLFPLLIALAIRTEPARGRRLAINLGLMSYALYATHKPLVSLIDNGARKGFDLDFGRFAPATGFVLGAAIVLLAWLLAIADQKLRLHHANWRSRAVR